MLDALAQWLVRRLVEDVTRVEVIDEAGRVYTRWGCRVKVSVQDDCRTLKVFTSSGQE